MSPVEYLRPILVLAMLGYASFKDLKTREVNDVVWLVFGASGLALNLYEASTGSIVFLNLMLPMAFMILFAVASGFLGFFGGADLLAFVTLPASTSATRRCSLIHRFPASAVPPHACIKRGTYRRICLPPCIRI